jgi:hypothetical protein
MHEAERDYSLAVRPRDIAGSLALSCQNRAGEPCGGGAGGFTNLDSGAGYGSVISLFTRLRLVAGTEAYEPDFSVDRIRLRGTAGPITADVGRDVLRLGPSQRTQLGWGTNAPPVDRVHVFTSRPLELTSALRLEGDYALARLRAPQTYPGNLVSITHGQVDIGDDVELGIVQLLQMGGEGAPHLGVWDFLAEHVRRGDKSASSTDSSNRRFGGDAAVRVPSLYKARIYYQLIFEDIRKARFIDALRYDADHLFGIEAEPAGVGVVVEWQQTGVRSQEMRRRCLRVVGSRCRRQSSRLGSSTSRCRATAMSSLSMARSIERRSGERSGDIGWGLLPACQFGRDSGSMSTCSTNT